MDAEADGQPTPTANGDDSNGATPDDEDGVTLGGLVASATVNMTGSVTVDLQNPNATANVLNAWIDFNRDGDWGDTGEQIFTNRSLGTTAGPQTLNFTIPAGASAGTTFARFRLSTASNLTPGGEAPDGEVEDYQVIVAIDATAPSTTSFVRQTPATSPTNADTLVFRATFSEAVANVDTGDFAVTGTTATVTNVAVVSTSQYDVTVSGGNLATFNGTVGLNLKTGQNITDLAGNPLPTTEPTTDETYTLDNLAPAAGTVTAPHVGTGGVGQTSYQFTIQFTDNVAINVATLDGSDVTVTGPNSFSQLAAFVSVSPAGNGTPRTATYQITPPGGSWDAADFGKYTIGMNAAQVLDTAGNAVPANASLKTFTVGTAGERAIGCADGPQRLGYGRGAAGVDHADRCRGRVLPRSLGPGHLYQRRGPRGLHDDHQHHRGRRGPDAEPRRHIHWFAHQRDHQ